MRGTWHFHESSAQLESSASRLLEIQYRADGMNEAIFEQVTWQLLDQRFWEPSTVILRNGIFHAVLSRPLGNNRAVLTIVDGDRYHFKFIPGSTPRLSLVNGMGREVMVQRAVGPDLSEAELRIHRERVPRGDLAALILMAGHAFHGLMRERQRHLASAQVAGTCESGPQHRPA